MNQILIHEISKSFGEKEVLKNVSFQVSDAEIFGLLGPSGAGKTTLIKILTGQLTYQGQSEILGKSCDKLDRSIYEKMGMVMDNSGVYDRLSCLDNMKLFARLHRISPTNVTEALHQVGLSDVKISAGKLSKGMKQRLVLARAMLHHPKILFLDEPTSGLDPSTANEIHNLLLKLKETGTTIFLTTHNMEEAYKLCDHVALLSDGLIVEYGVPEELCRKYNQNHIITILCRDGNIITFPNEAASAGSIAELLSGNQVETIHSSEPNLEQVFLSLTGKELNR